MATTRKKRRVEQEEYAWRLLRTENISAEGNAGTVRFRSLLVCEEEAPEYVLLSNFMIDIDWLVDTWPELVGISRVVIFVHDMQPTSLFEVHRMVPGDLFSNGSSRWNPFAYGSHHSKFVIIGYRTHLRLIITTANFIERDVNGKTQGVWWRDFPLKESPTCEFEDVLVDYVDSLLVHAPSARSGEWGHLKGSLAEVLRRYDFSDARARLVPSIPGRHSASERKYGHLRLRHLVNGGGGHKTVAQFSSCASTSPKYMDEMMRSLGGGDNLQIVWPTVREVRDSIDGYASGQALPSTTTHVEKLRRRFCRWSRDDNKGSSFVDARRFACPHLKSFTRFNRDHSIAWSLMTSHNISQSAWGQLQQSNTTLLCANWELGVFVSNDLLKCERMIPQSSSHDRSGNTVIVPLPFPTSPTIPYGIQDRPWAARRGKASEGLMVYPDLPDRFGSTSIAPR